MYLSQNIDLFRLQFPQHTHGSSREPSYILFAGNQTETSAGNQLKYSYISLMQTMETNTNA